MKVLILENATAVSERAARIVVTALGRAPQLVLGMAIGETMRPFYAQLVAAHRAGNADFAAATTFNLDEYVGVGSDNPASFAFSCEPRSFAM